MKSTTELAADVIADHLPPFYPASAIAEALDDAGLLKNELQYLYGQELRKEWAARGHL